MSLTEVQTQPTVGTLHSKPRILRLVNGGRPHPMHLIEFEGRTKHEDIELAELKHDTPSRVGTDVKAKATPSPSPEPTKLSWIAHAQFASLCMSLFIAGWNDGTTGPLLPRMQSNYHVCLQPLMLRVPLSHWSSSQVGYAVVSLIFIVNCVVSA